MRRTLISLIAIAVTVPLMAVFAQKSPPVSKTFKVGAGCKIVVGENKAGTLTDLKVGDKIRIAYHDDGTTSVADRIHLNVEPKGEGKTGKEHVGGKKEGGDTMAHGIITAVDTTAGTVTVNVHQKAAATK
jgi:hypothetical protein